MRGVSIEMEVLVPYIGTIDIIENWNEGNANAESNVKENPGKVK